MLYMLVKQPLTQCIRFYSKKKNSKYILVLEKLACLTRARWKFSHKFLHKKKWSESTKFSHDYQTTSTEEKGVINSFTSLTICHEMTHIWRRREKGWLKLGEEHHQQEVGFLCLSWSGDWWRRSIKTRAATNKWFTVTWISPHKTQLWGHGCLLQVKWSESTFKCSGSRLLKESLRTCASNLYIF